MHDEGALQDVLIIGGGPAGSTCASLLAMKGREVTLLEKAAFPRDHVGESLLPFCYPILDELGVLEKLKMTFVRKPGVRFIDVDGKHHTTWCFGHVIKDESYLSFHVRRAEFDKILLDNSREKGAKVFEETRVSSVDLDGPDGQVIVKAVGPDGREQEHRARFLIDATGRDTFLATQKRWKRPHDQLDRAAFSTHWAGGKYIGGIQEGLLQIVYLGGDKKGWIWIIPVGADRLSVGVVLNHGYIREQRAKLEESGTEDWRADLYAQELASSELVREILADAKQLMPLMLNGNYSYVVERKYGDNFALVGDASTFIDPIFASGVFLSMKSAQLVCGALEERLGSETGGDRNPLEEAYAKINGAYALVDKAIHLFYNPDAINFAQAGSAAPLIHGKHENALALGHYLVAGDFFERHAEYSEFIDLLQDRNLFDKYKHLVIDRAEYQTDSCGLSPFEVFHELLRGEAGTEPVSLEARPQ